MKYELKVRDGKYNGENWEREWHFEIETPVVFSNDAVKILYVLCCSSSIVLSINEIPYRIENIDGDIWLRGKHYCKLFPEPEKPSYANSITVIYQYGEREEKTLEEVGA